MPPNTTRLIRTQRFTSVFLSTRGGSQSNKKLVQLSERLVAMARAARGDCLVKRRFRRIKLVYHDQCRTASLLEGDRGDLSGFGAFLVRPHQSRGRRRFQV